MASGEATIEVPFNLCRPHGAVVGLIAHSWDFGDAEIHHTPDVPLSHPSHTILQVQDKTAHMEEGKRGTGSVLKTQDFSFHIHAHI